MSFVPGGLQQNHPCRHRTRTAHNCVKMRHYKAAFGVQMPKTGPNNE